MLMMVTMRWRKRRMRMMRRRRMRMRSMSMSSRRSTMSTREKGGEALNQRPISAGIRKEKGERKEEEEKEEEEEWQQQREDSSEACLYASFLAHRLHDFLSFPASSLLPFPSICPRNASHGRSGAYFSSGRVAVQLSDLYWFDVDSLEKRPCATRHADCTTGTFARNPSSGHSNSAS